jgi:hypothetical protein
MSAARALRTEYTAGMLWKRKTALRETPGIEESTVYSEIKGFGILTQLL